MIPAHALVDAGLRPPGDDRSDPTHEPLHTSVEDDAQLAEELVRAQTQVALLRDVVARQDEDVRFLRQLLSDAITARGAS